MQKPSGHPQQTTLVFPKKYKVQELGGRAAGTCRRDVQKASHPMSRAFCQGSSHVLDGCFNHHFVDPAGNLQVTTLPVSNPAGIQGFEMSRSTWTGPRGYVSVYGLGRQLSSQVPTLPTEYAASLEVRSTFEDSPGCEPLDRTTSV